VVHTFFHNTFNPRHFDLADLDRIWNEEGKFLERASGVFFESEWGMNMAKAAYSLVKDHYYVAGRGGVVSPPESDTWNGGDLRLVTIAMNFRQKGGDLVAAAFRLLEPRYPRLSWSIVGGPPDFDVGATSRITYEGFLRPDRPSEYARLREILSSAFLCVHPAREDVSPLVLTEAAYFGCPAVSVNVFGIPELVLDGRTGILLDPPPEPAAIAAAIESLLLDAKRYDEMRRHARDYALARFQWPHVGAIICDGIERALEK
jgi:glycosyltransferase involved in cell wall biosynthesis